MPKGPVTELPTRTKGRLLLLVFFLLLLYVVLPRLDNFSASFEAIKGAHVGQVAVAFGLVVLTYVCAAGVYQCLALKKLRFRRTLLVQAANGFANRLLPAGLGGLTLNIQYLKKSGYTLPQALTVAATNNTLGMVGHLLLLGIAIVASDGKLVEELALPNVAHAWLIVLTAAVLIAVNLFVFQGFRLYLQNLALGVLTYVGMYRKRPLRLVGALAWSLGLTSFYVLTFYLCSLAVGSELSLWSAYVVFTVGMIATTVTPTPGGLGGTEAALVAGMVAYGADASVALASVLLYRFLTYWLPLLPGFIVFLSIRKRYL